MKLNEIQEIAVKEIDKNISLVAGAGTGKTRVLTNRFIEIMENVPPSKILALTFTKKASTEMKTRILQSILDKNVNRDELNIMTIHSFCLEIIREYANELNLDPNFKVISETESNLFIVEIITKVIREKNSDLFLKFIEDFKLDESFIVSIFYNLYKKVRNHNIDIDLLEKKTFRTFKTSIKFNDIKNKLLELGLNKSLKNLNKFINSKEFNEIFSKSTYQESDLMAIRNNLGSSKKFINEIENINESLDELSLLLDNYNYGYYKIIIEILRNIDDSYCAIKEKESLIDYDDHMIFINTLLDIEYIRKEINNRFSYILVDEFQDTNELQNEILKKINPKNLFVVGDPKQSIYGFRGSDIESYYNFSNNLEEKGMLLNMDVNYRTSSELISKINYIFEDLINNYIPLRSYRNSTRNIEFFEIIEEKGNSLQKLIVNLLEKYKYEDILVLSRSNKDLDEIYKVLKEEGIPSKKTKTFLTEEGIIRYVLNLMSALYNAEDLLSFLAYMSSYYVDLNFNIIVQLLLEDIKSIDDILNLNIKNANFIRAIRLYKKLLKYKNKLFIDEMIGLIISELSKFNHITDAEYEYLFILRDKAREFLEESSNSFIEFVKYVETTEIEDLNIGVTISTIHSSKGLEYKVVVLYNMDKKLIQNKNKFLIDKDLGIGIDSELSSGKHRLIKKKIISKEEDEEKRLFYVAATRAKDRLIFASKIKNSNTLSYYKLIKDKINAFDKLNIDSSKIYIRKNKDNFLKNITINEKAYRYRENYSISDFLNFRISKKYFYENYYFGKDSIVNNLNKKYILDPVVRGNIVHEFAAKYNGIYGKEFIEKIFERQNEKFNDKKYNYVKKYLDNYLQMKDKDIRNIELGFYYNFKGNIVRGFIDQIVYNDGYYLIDLKTSDNSENEILKYYTPQLQLYSKIYEDIYGIKLKGAYIYSLKNKKKLEVDISNEKISKVCEEFESFINFIKTHIRYDDYR